MSARYTPMPHADFLSALEEAGLSCADFAAIANMPVENVTRMMIGLDRVDYRASLLVTLLTVPSARELALMHADVFEPEQAYVEPRWSKTFMQAAPSDNEFHVGETIYLNPPIRIGPPESA